MLKFKLTKVAYAMAALVGLDEARRRSTLPKAVFDALLLLSAQRYEMAAVKFEGQGAVAGARREHRRVRSHGCLLYTSPSPRDGLLSRMPSSA